MKRSERIAKQLGMSQGAATHRLRKNLLFSYVQMAAHNFCHVCGEMIDNVDDFSIEHKEPWEGRDSDLFWNLDNIAFSHVQCNRPHVRRSGGEQLRKITREGYSWCGSCKMELPVEDFYKASANWHGLNRYCKSCHNARNKKMGE